MAAEDKIVLDWDAELSKISSTVTDKKNSGSLSDAVTDMLISEIAAPYKKAPYSEYAGQPIRYINEVLRSNITPAQQEICNALLKHKRVMVKSCHCLQKDTLIPLASGEITPVVDLIGREDVVLFTLDAQENLVRAKAEVSWNGLDEIYQLTMMDGSKLACNGIHPLYTPSGWVEVKDLKPGMKLALTTTLPAFGQVTPETPGPTELCAEVDLYTEEAFLRFLEGYLPKRAYTCRVGRNSCLPGNPCTISEGFLFNHEHEVRHFYLLMLRLGLKGCLRYNKHRTDSQWSWETRELERLYALPGVKSSSESLHLNKHLNLVAQEENVLGEDEAEAPKNTAWVILSSVIKLPEKEQTVNIEVPGYGSYLTTFYEHNSSGKCVAPNTDIYLSSGKRVKASSLIHEPFFKLATLGPLGAFEVVGRAEWNKYEPVYTIVTESGRTLTANVDHPLWMAMEQKKFGSYLPPNVQGWTPLGVVEAGDLLAVTSEYPFWGETNLDEETIQLCAHLLYSAFWENGQIGLLIKTPEQYDSLSQLLFRRYALRLPQGEAGPAQEKFILPHSEESSQRLESFMSGIGLSSRLGDREVPQLLQGFNRQGTIELLKHLFISPKVVSSPLENKIKISHRSERLIRDLSFLWLKLGVTSRVYQRENGHWSLSVLGLSRYRELLGQNLTDNDILAEKRNEWRLEDAPVGTHWEKIVALRYSGKTKTVAINVPRHETFLTDFYQHNSYLAGALVNYNYDVNDESITLTTAPNEEVVKDVIWKEVRSHRSKVPEHLQDLSPKDTRMQNGPSHFATGYVAASEAGARGRKSKNLLIVFDEADGIRPEFYDSAEGMLIGEDAMHLVLLNPVHSDSRAALEEENFHTIRLSALDHPNVLAPLIAGRHLTRDELPYPGIDMHIGWVNDKISRMCRRIEAHNVKAGTSDFQWPPIWMYQDKRYEKFLKEIGAEEPVFYRPKSGTEFEPRVLGQWMSNTDTALWSDALWESASEERPLNPRDPVQIGIDQAGKGKDTSSFVVIQGDSVLWHEFHAGWDGPQIAERAKILATTYAFTTNMTAETVPVKLDTTGGNGAYDLRGNFNFIPVSNQERALEPDRFDNRRSEVWCNAADRASELEILPDGEFRSKMDLSRLIKNCPEGAKEIKRQLKAATYRVKLGNKRTVEPKEAMQKKLRRSPDDADAFNLAFASFSDNQGGQIPATVLTKQAADMIRRRLGGKRRN